MVIVKETESGEFRVVRGGDVYRTWNGRAVPGTVKAGDMASAAEICEWIENGATVQDQGSAPIRAR